MMRSLLIFGTVLMALMARWELLSIAVYRNVATLALTNALHGASVYHLGVADRAALYRADQLLAFVLARSNTPRLHEFSALISLASGDQQTAVQHWVAADSFEQLVVRGDAARVAGAYVDAGQWYSIATQIRPQASSSWCAQGLVAASSEAAYTFLSQATARDTGWRNEDERVGCWLEFGIRSYNTPISNWDVAFVAFEVVTQAGKPSMWRQVSEAYRLQGMILEERAGPQTARPFFDRALGANPLNPWAIVSSAENTYRLNGDLPGALSELRAAMSLALDDQWLPIDIVVFLANQNLLPAAREFCLRAPYRSFEDRRFADICISAEKK